MSTRRGPWLGFDTLRLEGARVREGWRIGVEAALVTLGEGFLKHTANEPLGSALIAGAGRAAPFARRGRLAMPVGDGVRPSLRAS